MSDPAYARPGQVTVAGWAVAAASVIVVLAVFQTMGELNSVDMRESVRRSLTEGTFRGLDLSVQQALDLIRWGLYVAGVAAVATGILGIYVLQKNHAARLVLSVAAVPVVLMGGVVGWLPSMVVGAGAAMLWSLPARDWFAGRPITRPEPPRPAARQLPPADTEQVRDLKMPGEHPVTPPPTPSWGAPAQEGLNFPAPTTAPVWPTVPPTAPPTDSRMAASIDAQPGRPPQVRLACLLTWVFSAVSGFGAAALLVAVGVARDRLVDEVVNDSRWDNSMDRDLIVPAVLVFGAVVLVWCLLNAALAWFVWRGRRGAWLGLAVSIGAAAIFATAGFPFSLVHMAALAISLGMLLSLPSRHWFTRP